MAVKLARGMHWWGEAVKGWRDKEKWHRWESSGGSPAGGGKRGGKASNGMREARGGRGCEESKNYSSE